MTQEWWPLIIQGGAVILLVAGHRGWWYYGATVKLLLDQKDIQIADQRAIAQRERENAEAWRETVEGYKVVAVSLSEETPKGGGR